MQCARATEVTPYHIYFVRVPTPVAHGYGTPSLFMRPLRNTSSYAKRASSTVILASADVASFLSASTNHCGCTGTDHRFRSFYVTNLTGNF